jgi:hypothetical protein
VSRNAISTGDVAFILSGSGHCEFIRTDHQAGDPHAGPLASKELWKTTRSSSQFCEMSVLHEVSTSREYKLQHNPLGPWLADASALPSGYAANSIEMML